MLRYLKSDLTQLIFTSSKSTIETYFTPFSGVSIVGFEQVNVSWVGSVSGIFKHI